MKSIIETSLVVDAEKTDEKASRLLAELTGLSQATIKDAMQKGAVWLQRGKRNMRLRRNSTTLQSGDTLSINYNAELLASSVPEPLLVHDAGDYSIWFKPFGMPCQGSRWGDFASINRWVEMNLARKSERSQRPVFLVHRLDRATTGLLLLAHSKNTARLFSDMFRSGDVDKRYQAVVQGDFSTYPQDFEVNDALEGKPSRSRFSFVAGDEQKSLLDIRLLTGRKHQIRRHLSGLGFPIVGDRLYGTADASDRDLQLQSVLLRFVCPITAKERCFEVPVHLRIVL
jgi:tRNA pseudouridine32 synthase/23S rRNA pseudouridine746 synthase